MDHFEDTAKITEIISNVVLGTGNFGRVKLGTGIEFWSFYIWCIHLLGVYWVIGYELKFYSNRSSYLNVLLHNQSARCICHADLECHFTFYYCGTLDVSILFNAELLATMEPSFLAYS